MENENCLKVRMLGDFTMTYYGQPIEIGKNQTTKVMQLLQLLLYAGSRGIARTQLMEYLYDSDMEGDRANNLRVNIFYLRRRLEESELPKETYIRTENGRYYFDSSFPVEIDAICFRRLIEAADQEKDEERFELLKKACYSYVGCFLPALAGEEWAAIEEAQLQSMYFSALEEVCQWMKSREDYAELLPLVSRAASLYPFEEWQIWQMECLIGLKRPKDAIALYEKTSELYFNELDMPPTKKMVECFRRMSQQIQLKTSNFHEIQFMLQEKEETEGAYYCPYPSFVDMYRMMVRVMERSGQSVYLLLCTLDAKRQAEDHKRLKELSGRLSASIQEALRRGDIFTCYNLNQYLVILTGICKEECSIVTYRIDACFRKRESSRRIHINYRMASIMHSPERELGISPI